MRLHRAGNRERQQMRRHLGPFAGIRRGGRGDAAGGDAPLQCRIDLGEGERHRRCAEPFEQRGHGGGEGAHALSAQIVEGADRLAAEQHLRAEGPDGQNLGAEAGLDALVEGLAEGVHRGAKLIDVGGNADEVDALQEGIVARGKPDLRRDDVEGPGAHEAQRIGKVDAEGLELAAVDAHALRRVEAFHRRGLDRELCADGLRLAEPSHRRLRQSRGGRERERDGGKKAAGVAHGVGHLPRRTSRRRLRNRPRRGASRDQFPCGRLARRKGCLGVHPLSQRAFGGSRLPGRRQPDFSPQGNLVANSEEGDLNNLILMGPLGEDPRLISAHPEDGRSHWAISGKTLVFESTYEGDRRQRLYLQQDTNYGATVSPLRYDAWEIFGRYPVFLNDGRIAYNGCDIWENGSVCGVYLVDTSGGKPVGVTDWPGDLPSDNLGSQVLVTSSRGGNWDVYLVNPTNGAVQRLTDSPAHDGLATASPDGNYVAFVSDRDGAWGVYTMRTDGSEQQKLFEIEFGYGSGDHDWLEERLSWGW